MADRAKELSDRVQEILTEIDKNTVTVEADDLVEGHRILMPDGRVFTITEVRNVGPGHVKVDVEESDPYDKVVFVQGHRHSEPVCAWPDCITYLTHEEMDALPDVGTPYPSG